MWSATNNMLRCGIKVRILCIISCILIRWSLHTRYLFGHVPRRKRISPYTCRLWDAIGKNYCPPHGERSPVSADGRFSSVPLLFFFIFSVLSTGGARLEKERNHISNPPLVPEKWSWTEKGPPFRTTNACIYMCNSSKTLDDFNHARSNFLFLVKTCRKKLLT